MIEEFAEGGTSHFSRIEDDKNSKNYVVTSADNDGDKRMNWNEIVTIQPKLNGLQSEFLPKPLSSEEQAIINKYRRGLSPEEFKKLPPEDISFPRGLNGLNTYSDSVMMYKKGTPIHVKGAILYNHYLKQYNLSKKYPFIQEGEKLKFTYLKMPNPFKDTVISYPSRLPPEFGLQDYIDYDTQFDKSYLDPIRIILDCMNWKTEKTSSIEDFFS